ncbi:hypothetical protein PHYBLDRAFT_170460 [Phycomyces blakesleeanus NRRL 1555(-)]|uniref:Endonuclease/exonuclease/phosphatase domain-containing protein n=1 Tax=Phycomyces blakesleeanus (strain ATCC 8743b / DSM 1359 / FGSC 10004 / NBRC 33097 / NRRL 1555) TaxID=763407 RepID=A0A162U2I6_PHYB8|nr:hypothetical protein PHYBLDRAFT_170460 [Phycomyces blakesleeanus NRRL 1555(-)]OAD71813.1 hypothetical protein PHYBLDRAFT_170460 [Phycomyces blakesleeanus NRRL 1555(-)]|eukprot:XP_018289853.1 hypothetical protein PHYBLDRAFT_170460 [Phycomyces blakesleeanus NRRL 1555(-)]
MQSSISTLLQAQSSTWSHHCGLVSFNPEYHIEPHLNSFDPTHLTDSRLLTATIHHVHKIHDPLNFFVIYAPAHPEQRPLFYSLLDHYLAFSSPPLPKSVLFGDLNYNTRLTSSPPLPTAWTQWLSHHWFDAITPVNCTPLPTFTTGSTLDFLFVTNDLKISVHSPVVEYVAGSWTDHFSISIQLSIGSPQHGPGIWRFNPYLLSDKEFCNTMTTFLDAAETQISNVAPHIQWDLIKANLKAMAIDHSRKARNKAKTMQKILLEQRSAIVTQLHSQSQSDSQLRHPSNPHSRPHTQHTQHISNKEVAQEYLGTSQPQSHRIVDEPHTSPTPLTEEQEYVPNSLDDDPSSVLHQQLLEVEHQIDCQQEVDARIIALRSGHKWREHGECSNAYFYQCLKERRQAQNI